MPAPDAPPFPSAAIYAALCCWNAVHGLGALEMLGHRSLYRAGPDEVFRHELTGLLHALAGGLRPSHG